MDKLLIPPEAPPEPESDRVPHIPPTGTYAKLKCRPPAPYKVPWCYTYSEEVAERICDEIAKGRTLFRITVEEAWAPPYRTIYTWFKNHPEFREGVEAAREVCGEQLAHDILDVAYSRIPIEDKRSIIDAHKWIAGTLNSRYRDRKVVEQTVDANLNVNTVQQIDVSAMTMDELKALESAFGKMIELQPNEVEEDK